MPNLGFFRSGGPGTTTRRNGVSGEMHPRFLFSLSCERKENAFGPRGNASLRLKGAQQS